MTTARARRLAREVGALLRARGATLATAESCTGGLVGALLTDVAGSSDYFVGGVVAYANHAKTILLDVDPALLATDGAVSARVAAAMAEGARWRLGADVAVSLTGIAGPGGGSAGRPVGLVFIGVAGAAGTRTTRHVFTGGRAAVRAAAACAAIEHVIGLLEVPAGRVTD